MINRDKKIGWGILGCGKIAHKFASDLMLSQHAKLVACASRDQNKSVSFGQKYHVTYTFDNYEEMIKCDAVDVVYIATPHAFHYEQTLLCLHNLKAVLCEKPLGLNYLQVKEMIELAKEKKIFLMEAMWTAFLPNINTLKKCIADDEIGKIVKINAQFGFQADYDPNSRLFNSSLGGGVMLDIGIYPIYLSYLLLGKPATYQSVIKNATTGVDVTCNVLLTYLEGTRATLFSTFEKTVDTYCEIYGTKGIIKIPNRFHEQDHFILSKKDSADHIYKSEKIGFGYYYEIEHTNECLYAGITESPIMSYNDSLAVSAIIYKTLKLKNRVK